MIAFLTLLYCGVLLLLVKVGIIRLTTFWKASPLLWALLLFIVLFLPMQWGAPSGPVRTYSPVVDIQTRPANPVLDYAAVRPDCDSRLEHPSDQQVRSVLRTAPI